MRAQVAIELFLTMSIGLLVLFWYSNYLTAFGDSVRGTGLNQEQKLVTKSLVKSINEACAREVNLTLAVPCLVAGPDNLPYEIDVDAARPNVVRVSNTASGLNTSEAAVCNVADELPQTVQCGELARLCAYKNSDASDRRVHLTGGACA